MYLFITSFLMFLIYVFLWIFLSYIFFIRFSFYLFCLYKQFSCFETRYIYFFFKLFFSDSLFFPITLLLWNPIFTFLFFSLFLFTYCTYFIYLVMTLNIYLPPLRQDGLRQVTRWPLNDHYSPLLLRTMKTMIIMLIME